MRVGLLCATLLATLGFVGSCSSQQQVTSRTVSSITELRQYAGESNQKVTLKPGEYWLDKNGKNPAFLDLSGTNSTFIFTGCHIKVDSQNLKGFGSGHENRVRLILLSGTNITVDGLTLSTEIVDGKEGWADMYSNSIEITGSGATLRNINLTTRGSRPYGSGDAFGKGGRPANGNQSGGVPFKLHSKHNGIRTGNGAGNVTLENIELRTFSFGHGIYFQEGAHDILVKNCRVIGDEMASSNDIIADPLYQQYGKATYGEKIPADIRISKHEDGIRVYGPGGNFGAVKNVRIENTKVERMRDAYAMGDMEGKLEIINSESWGCEQGFTPARTGATFTNCKGDAVNGPLLFFRRSGNGVTADVELAGDQPAQGRWPIAIISGKGNKVTLTRTAPAKLYPENAFVEVSQTWREWRHRPDSDIDTSRNIPATTECTITNKTGQLVVLGVKATNNTVTSDAPVIDKGKNNTVQAPAWTPHEIRIKDTWGEYQVYPAAATAAVSAATSTIVTAVAPTAAAVAKAEVPAPR
jgi:hypothetical protein